VSIKVSIITSCYTSERIHDIQQLIDSIARQNNQEFEAIIVAERSIELKNAISDYILANAYINFKVLFNTGPHGISAARNLAISQAQGDILSFVDDDAVVDCKWVDSIIKTFEEDDSVIGVTGPIKPLWENQSMVWFPPEFYWIFSCTSNDPLENIEVRNGYGTNLSFDRQAFLKCGLFDPELGVKGRGKKGWQEPGAEETEISIRIKKYTGKRIIFNPDVKVEHRVYSYRISSKFITKRAFWEGYAKSLLKSKLRKNESDKEVLSTEYSLLKRILFYRIPKDILLLFKDPKIAVRQMGVVFMVIPCVAAGYFKRNFTFNNKR
jgi:glucosyl-dolichyl phosphate glucuronosyltransferase